jgi:spermidine/putrescine transport system substrate-binding protein
MFTIKRSVSLIIASSIILLLLGCSSQAEPEATATSESAPVEEESKVVLNFYNWDTYIAPEILSDFEEKFDVTINYQIFDDMEEMLAGMQSGEIIYDLVVPSDFTLSQMRQDNMLTPLNKANIPNFSNLAPEFVNPVHDPDNRYCAPYQWGTVGFGYNIEATGPITSLDDIFSPEFAGRVGLMNDPRTTMEIILLYLGYSPNTTNKEEIDEAAQYLKDHADIIAAYHGDDGQDLLNDGTLDIVLEWSGDIFQVMEENENIRYLIPPSGSILWNDFICIPANAEYKELAETFINYLLEPEVGAALSNYVQYGSPNQAAMSFLDEEVRNNPAIYPPAEVRANLYSEVDVGAETFAYYEAVWEEVLSTIP